MYQRGSQNPYIAEEQTRQWPKERILKDKQESRKHTDKTKDRVTRTLLEQGVKKHIHYIYGRYIIICIFLIIGNRFIARNKNPIKLYLFQLCNKFKE
jgi:hypothetical protein